MLAIKNILFCRIKHYFMIEREELKVKNTKENKDPIFSGQILKKISLFARSSLSKKIIQNSYHERCLGFSQHLHIESILLFLHHYSFDI